MIQIIGTKSCAQTRAAIRFLKERRADYQFVDLKERSLSKGELENIFSRMAPEECIDKDDRTYAKLGLEYKVYDAAEELEGNNLLFRTPILRSRGRVAIGYDETFLKGEL